MTRAGLNGSMKLAASLLVAGALPSMTPANAGPVNTADAACNLVKARVSERGNFPVSAIAFCDIIPEADSPGGYYVLALHSRRSDCEGICSTNMGWFAVQRTTGRVFEWDVAEQAVGSPVTIKGNP